jgi:transcriptional regulator with XRE-family HTH domain
MAGRRRTRSLDPDYAQRVGRAIQVLRTELGLSRTDLAEDAGVSYSYLSEIETGKKQLSSNTLLRLAEVLDVSPSELMAAAEERVRPSAGSAGRGTTVLSAPPATQMAPTAGAAPTRSVSRWFGRGNANRAGPQPGEAASVELEELRTILDRLSPEDRELLLDFARRLARS